MQPHSVQAWFAKKFVPEQQWLAELQCVFARWLAANTACSLPGGNPAASPVFQAMLAWAASLRGAPNNAARLRLTAALGAKTEASLFCALQSCALPTSPSLHTARKYHGAHVVGARVMSFVAPEGAPMNVRLKNARVFPLWMMQHHGRLAINAKHAVIVLDAAQRQIQPEQLLVGCPDFFVQCADQRTPFLTLPCDTIGDVKAVLNISFPKKLYLDRAEYSDHFPLSDISFTTVTKWHPAPEDPCPTAMVADLSSSLVLKNVGSVNLERDTDGKGCVAATDAGARFVLVNSNANPVPFVATMHSFGLPALVLGLDAPLSSKRVHQLATKAWRARDRIAITSAPAISLGKNSRHMRCAAAERAVSAGVLPDHTHIGHYTDDSGVVQWLDLFSSANRRLLSIPSDDNPSFELYFDKCDHTLYLEAVVDIAAGARRTLPSTNVQRRANALILAPPMVPLTFSHNHCWPDATVLVLPACYSALTIYPVVGSCTVAALGQRYKNLQCLILENPRTRVEPGALKNTVQLVVRGS